MRGLIDKLNEASRRYYDQNESDISDDEWDAMYAELRKLEEKTGERMAEIMFDERKAIIPFEASSYCASLEHG